MSEIQSAEEFLNNLSEAWENSFSQGDDTSPAMIDLIRVRDKAIVLEYTDKIFALFAPSKYYLTSAGKAAIKAEMVSFLRELGGEQ